MAAAVWPALEMQARAGGKVVTRDMYNKLVVLENLELFGVACWDTAEGRQVNRYLTSLPAYKNRNLTEIVREHHGYLVMQTSRLVWD